MTNLKSILENLLTLLESVEDLEEIENDDYIIEFDCCNPDDYIYYLTDKHNPFYNKRKISQDEINEISNDRDYAYGYWFIKVEGEYLPTILTEDDDWA